MTTSLFGRLSDGQQVQRYTLVNRNGLRAVLINYGATLTELHVPDRRGVTADIVLGHDDLAGYLTGKHYLGATVGRVANRIRNAEFSLDGQRISLVANEGPHQLHGGAIGFDKVLWHAEPMPGASAVRFTHVSPDGDQGYPGTVTVSQLVSLTDDNELTFGYTATTDTPTPINLTNHPYFNLSGSGDILGHELAIEADQYTPTDAALLPTGEVRLVRNTPFDFTQAHAIGELLGMTGGGYDHNFVLRGSAGQLRRAAVARDPVSGRVLELNTTLPAIQLYAGNFLDGSGKGQAHCRHAGFTLETQCYPDAVNHPSFPSTVLRPGETWRHSTTLKFSAQ